MDRGRLLLWLALFGAAIALGFWRPSRPAPGDRVDPRSIRVTVSVDGAVRVEAADGTDRVVGTLAADEAGAGATMERLDAQLRRLRSGAPTDALGHSLSTLDIRGPRVAPWRWFSWIARVAGANGVDIHHLQFRTEGDAREPVSVELQRPRKMQFDVLSWKGGCAVAFRLVRRTPGGAERPGTALVVGLRERGASDEPRMVPETVIATIESGPAGLSGWLSEHARELSACEAQIGVEIESRTPQASSAEIPFGDVVDTMNVLRTFGFQPLTY